MYLFRRLKGNSLDRQACNYICTGLYNRIIYV